MTFLDDIWKKFKTVPKAKEIRPTTENTVVISPDTTELKNFDALLNAYEHTEVEALRSATTFKNMEVLKTLVDEPKEEFPELRFSKIKQHLGDPECHETVRQERWHINLHCTACSSLNLKRIPQIPSKSPNNHRYRCLDCGHEFSDDSESPLERGTPPLQVWMQCWYLLGCTDSLMYIATKLGLELAVIESMVRQLQKIFNAKKPLTHFLSFEEWSEQTAALRHQLQDDLQKQYEHLNANIATLPKDTAEFRRQQNLRRTLDTVPEPPITTPGKKRG
jgi:transposase-like protein